MPQEEQDLAAAPTRQKKHTPAGGCGGLVVFGYAYSLYILYYIILYIYHIDLYETQSPIVCVNLHHILTHTNLSSWF